MADPGNVFAIDDIRSLSGLDVRPVVATKADVTAAIDRYHRGDDELDELTMSIDAGEQEGDLAPAKEIVEDAPIVTSVTRPITQASTGRASGSQAARADGGMRVRSRPDGVLHRLRR